MNNLPFMRRLNLSKNPNEQQSKGSVSQNQSFIALVDWKYGLNWMTLMGIAVACLMGLSGLFSVTVVLQDIQSNTLWAWQGNKLVSVDNHQDPSGGSSHSVNLDNDNLAGGLEKELQSARVDMEKLATRSKKESHSIGVDKEHFRDDLKATGVEKQSWLVGHDKDNSPRDLSAAGGEKQPKSLELDNDNLLDGLLASGVDKKSCLSRYQTSFYRKESTYKPAAHLVSKLRDYEALHKRCGPHTESYNKVVELITTTQQLDNSSDCNYLVWISYSGLENRILSLASAFLYAMITNRVLLIDRGADTVDLFCEPFPDTSWLLPVNFPLLDQFNTFNKKSPVSYGNMLRNYIISSSTLTYPPYLYLHLANDYDNYDKLFFCDQDQNILHKVPWLIMKTDNYFIPSLFLLSSFKQQLNKLFPQKDTVFHFLGRYLFHPTNTVWGLITRYHDTYLAKADERVAIEIRETEMGMGPMQHVVDQIMACTTKEHLLPQPEELEEVAIHPQKQKVKAVLLTSQSSGYYDSLKNIYWEKPTVSGEIVSVHQPSIKDTVKTTNKMKTQKAWVEMYILSMSDVLVTSSWSTFGYVAQGLGGLRPWILYKTENQTVPDPPCQRAMSMEPCFLAPPTNLCKTKKGTDTGLLVPHVKHCEDMSLGLKLVHT